MSSAVATTRAVKEKHDLRCSFAVALLGARMHYAVPRILAEAGALDRLFTDLSAARSWPRLLRLVPERFRPAAVKRLLGRNLTGIPSERITAFSTFGLKYALRRTQARSTAESLRSYLWAGRVFCEQALRCGLGEAGGVFTFNSAGLELLREARSQGRLAVMEQTIAPYRMECCLLREERERFPGWEIEDTDGGVCEEFCEREENEWRHADLILCGSNFVRESVAGCGGPAERCKVVPYGVEMPAAAVVRRSHDGPLRVLTVGSVGLRKGSPYVLEAARRLRGRAHFRVAGPLVVNQAAQRDLRAAVDLVGPVPRTEMAAHYAWADAFLLPSLCEGSATVTYEALSHGLPVICTPNTGSIVRHGLDGFLVPVRDSGAIAAVLELLVVNPGLREELSRNATARAAFGSLSSYKTRLLAALAEPGGVG